MQCPISGTQGNLHWHCQDSLVVKTQSKTGKNTKVSKFLRHIVGIISAWYMAYIKKDIHCLLIQEYLCKQLHKNSNLILSLKLWTTITAKMLNFSDIYHLFIMIIILIGEGVKMRQKCTETKYKKLPQIKCAALPENCQF